MPEGDTLRRTADVLARILQDRVVRSARGRPGGAHVERVVGATVERVGVRGKHLLIDFSGGLTLHTHLGMNGAWHRYRTGEPWHVADDRAVAVIEVDGAVAVCFDAPTVELIETKALGVHPVLSRLGPDLLAPMPDIDVAVARLRHGELAQLPIAVTLLDQRATAGLGNVYRSEILFIERVDPFARSGVVDRATVERLVTTGAELLSRNLDGGGRVTMPDASGAYSSAPRRSRRDARLWVYRRTGRPCRRCGSIIRSQMIGALPRRLYWCPACQAE